MARKERYLVGLDVGTSKVTAVVGEVMGEGQLDVIGVGLAESRGIKRGMVVNLDAAVDSIKRAVEEAELTAGIEIDAVHLALSGAHVKGFKSRGVVAVAGKNRQVAREDVRRAIDAAKAVALPSGREILHVMPQDFVVDDQDGIGAPVGMTGSRLEANVHIITGNASSTQNIVACVNRAGVEVVETVLEQIAAAEAVLTPDERELGVALVDVGGGTTDFAIFERGSLWHTGVISVGGDHFTNDIAVGLRTPVPDADRVKRRCGLRAGRDGRRGRGDGGGQRRRAQAADQNPKGKEMFQQLSEFEVNHYQKLKSLLKNLQEKGEWILYEGTNLKKKSIPVKSEKPKGQEQLTDMDALKIAVQEEKKAEAFYRSMAELTRDARGKDMYKRLANEEALHEKVLNDQYYSLHNTGIWSWGD